jgi:RimJ/RimL family protein N-acetyltransferase
MAAAVPTVETERLVLRPWRPGEDLDALASLNADPRVMRWIAPFRPLSRAESAALLERIVAHWTEHGYGLWAVSPRAAAGDAPAGRAAPAAAECIGFAGLAVPAFLPAVLPAVEVGWRLLPAWWGRGLATEAARAAVAHAFGPLGLARVVSVVDPGNAASLRVVEKLGMRRGADRVHPVTRRRLRVFELDAPAGRGGAPPLP